MVDINMSEDQWETYIDSVENIIHIKIRVANTATYNSMTLQDGVLRGKLDKIAGATKTAMEAFDGQAHKSTMTQSDPMSMELRVAIRFSGSTGFAVMQLLR